MTTTITATACHPPPPKKNNNKHTDRLADIWFEHKGLLMSSSSSHPWAISERRRANAEAGQGKGLLQRPGGGDRGGGGGGGRRGAFGDCFRPIRMEGGRQAMVDKGKSEGCGRARAWACRHRQAESRKLETHSKQYMLRFLRQHGFDGHVTRKGYRPSVGSRFDG